MINHNLDDYIRVKFGFTEWTEAWANDSKFVIVLCRNYNTAKHHLIKLAETMDGTDQGKLVMRNMSFEMRHKKIMFIVDPEKTRGYDRHKTNIVDWRYK